MLTVSGASPSEGTAASRAVAPITVRHEIPQMMHSISALCSTPLAKGNYLVWENQFEGTLKIHNLMQFVSGTLPTPAIRLPDKSSNPDYEDYMKSDGIMLS